MPAHSEPTEDEVAAAVAAIRHLQAAAAPPQVPAAAWSSAARLEAQRLRPFRRGTPLAWGTIERLGRPAPAALTGITGL